MSTREHVAAAPAVPEPVIDPPADIGVVVGRVAARLDANGAIALSTSAGNAAVSRVMIQRQGTPSAPPAPAAGGMTVQQGVILSAAILDVSNGLNQVYLAQKTGVDNLRRDLEKKTEPGLTESIVWALVDAALGMGAKKVAELIATKVGGVAVDRLSKPVTDAINSAGKTLSPDTHEAVFTPAIEAAGKKHAAAVTAGLGSWASGKVTAGSAATRAKIAADMEATQQFLQGQELTLIDHLADHQSELTSTVTLALVGLPFAEAMTATVALREGARDAKAEADILQYLASSAAWAQALAGGSPDKDAALSEGARGVLFVKIADAPGDEFKIVGAKIEGMPDDARKRLRSTPAFQARSVRDWPVPKVIQAKGLYLAVQANRAVDDGAIRFGHEWLANRGRERYGMEPGGAPGVTAKIAGALLLGELDAKGVKDLGEMNT